MQDRRGVANGIAVASGSGGDGSKQAHDLRPVSSGQPNRKTTVAIVGGGFTGAATAWNLARRGPGIQILLFEPRAKLGAGLAYDTVDPVHRINVPASRMSIDSNSPNDFADWLEAQDYAAHDPEALARDGNLFPRRQAFGDYVSARVSPFVESGAIDHIRARVSALSREDAGVGWLLVAEDGVARRADRVVIATSHPAPSAPRTLSAMLEGHPRFIADATVPGALEPIRASDAVLVVGNGLTSADAIASLLRRGHSGPITSISRRGLRSRGHAAAPQTPHGDFTTRPIRSARLLTRRIREAIVQAGHFGVSWHAVLDAARAQGGEIWANLPLAERRRLVRHLRPFWDVHRFRIAPQVEDALGAAALRGQLETLAASVAAVSYNAGRIRTALRHARSSSTTIRDFDSVIITTGPAHNAVIDEQPYLRLLSDEGLANLDPVRLGLSCDRHSRLLDREGWPVPGLYVAGPLARGTFGELMGLPQVSDHAAAVAEEVLSSIVVVARERRQASSTS
jgi:uncharacterized NAD(P)/FAD-binding protein YdhS